MWVNRQGSNLTSEEVCGLLVMACGSSYTPKSLEATYPIGTVYQNGTIWFQRVS